MDTSTPSLRRRPALRRLVPLLSRRRVDTGLGASPTFPFSTAQRRPVGRYEPEADTKHDLDLLLNLTIILSCFHR